MKRLPLCLLLALLLALPARAASATPSPADSATPTAPVADPTAPASQANPADSAHFSSPADPAASSLLFPAHPAAASTDGRPAPARPDSFGVFRLSLYVLLIFAGAAALLVAWTRQRRGALLPGARPAAIQVCETRPLGHRQFLVLVRCGSRELLLGVGPDRLQHLCFLDSPAVPATAEEALPAPGHAETAGSAFARLLRP